MGGAAGLAEGRAAVEAEEPPRGVLAVALVVGGVEDPPYGLLAVALVVGVAGGPQGEQLAVGGAADP